MATTTIETDLKEVLAKIDNRLERIETTSQIQQPYVQKIPDLAEKVGEMKNWKQIG